MNRILSDLVGLLDLETIEQNIYRGQSRDLGGKSVFGGQVIGQALVAARRTVQDQAPHSLHAYFLRPGDMALPIVYEVERVRDGRSFSTRRVHAIQHGQPILSMIASFQKAEGGLDHQAQMPQVTPPEELPTLLEVAEKWVAQTPGVSERARSTLLREVPIEFKPVRPWNPLVTEQREPAQHIWFRAAGQLPDDPLLHRCVLAYASDFNLLSTALLPHGKGWFRSDMVVASIDHALWFHRDARVDDWLLYSMDSPSAQSARGFSRGLIFDRQGRLIASTTQESLMRLVDTP
ncbi:acyl-CoA thioesterase II [Solimonas sp. K1W22B-7]|uniref:acyl-CoA thioesterase II n=1 Tax=Solimonas sp. K1W22B-7 TaxID=2303331 RepID=UPI000E3313D4|nr:acyl-CoA thioesterase II [Solimonas sp. K1W22B-7]AXQ30847.1 acyl-CoA thioesterase II [Solimonas sp. K1W22B-7]